MALQHLFSVSIHQQRT